MPVAIIIIKIISIIDILHEADSGEESYRRTNGGKNLQARPVHAPDPMATLVWLNLIRQRCRTPRPIAFRRP